MKKCLSIIFSLVLLIAGICTNTPSFAAFDTSSDCINMNKIEPLFDSYAEVEKLEPVPDTDFDTECGDDIGSYKDNEALVTLTLPDGETSPLLKEGVFSVDKRISIRDVMDFGTFFAIYVRSSVLSTGELISTLSDYPYVTEVTPNYSLTQSSTDPLLSEQWYLNDETYEPGLSHYDVLSDSDISYKKEDLSNIPPSDNPPVVAVVDAGIDYTHEDLRDKMWENPYPSLPGKYGYDFCNNRKDPYPTSASDYHGTCVAGVIAASTDNGVGISGISRDARLMSLKIFDSDNSDNSGTIAIQLAAFEYIYKAKMLGANIVAVNCSFGVEPSAIPYSDIGSNVISVIDSTINKLGKMGVLFVYSAGNEGENLEKKPYGLPFQQDSTYLLVTGATNYKGDVSPYSNCGVNHVHLMAPGSTILTTTTRDNFLPASYDSNKKSRLCTFCEDFPSGKKTLLRNSENSTISVSHSSEDIHGDIQSGSGMVTIKDANSSNSDNYMVFYDVTDYPIDYSGSSKYYFSFVFQPATRGSGVWFDVSGRLGAHKAVQAWLEQNSGHYYLSINLKKLLGGDALSNGLKVFIDSFALSVANPNTSEFGKYKYSNGTSFAAPCVTGAVARLATVFPNESASFRKQFILENVQKKDTYTGKCSSGGLLNMSAFPTQISYPENPTIKAIGIKLNKKSAKLKAGKKLKLKASVSPSDAADKRVKWKVNKKSYASVNKKGVVKAKKKGRGHTVKVTAYLANNKKIKVICKIKIKK